MHEAQGQAYYYDSKIVFNAQTFHFYGEEQLLCPYN